MAMERTEKATPKRREDARKKGKIARGAELPAAPSFLGALIMLKFLAEDMFNRVGDSLKSPAFEYSTYSRCTDPKLPFCLLWHGRRCTACAFRG